MTTITIITLALSTTVLFIANYRKGKELEYFVIDKYKYYNLWNKSLATIQALEATIENYKLKIARLEDILAKRNKKLLFGKKIRRINKNLDNMMATITKPKTKKKSK